jgi:hypothetical protein
VFAACIVAVLVGWVAALVLGLVLLARAGFRWSAPHAAGARFREALGFGMPLQLANRIAVFHQLGKLLIVRLLSLAAVVPTSWPARLDRVQHARNCSCMIPEASGSTRRAPPSACASCPAAPAGSSPGSPPL